MVRLASWAILLFSLVLHGSLAKVPDSGRELFLFDFFAFLRDLFCGLFLYKSFCGNLAEEQTELVSGSVVDATVKFSCGDTEAQIAALGGASMTQGESVVYAGTIQKTSINQNPVVAKFTNGVLDWCREDYEVTGADSRAIGVMWQNDRLFAVFTTDGTQGQSFEDFRRFTERGWLPSYGSGGGPKVSVIVELDPTTGIGKIGTFLRAELSNGTTNSFVVQDIFMSDEFLLVQGNSFFLPLNSDGSRMTEEDCAPDTTSPFDYTVQLTLDLNRAVDAVCKLSWHGL